MPRGEKCPDISPSAPIAAVDYVDFLMAKGRQYIANLGKPLSIDPLSLRSQQLVVGCSFRQLNDKTGRETPKPAEGDAAFLLPGTVVYAVEGWSPRCRLAAEHDGVLHVYLAYLPGGGQATPDPCALVAGGGTSKS